MEEIIPTNEYTVVDDTAYVNPQVALDEGNKFIDNYRATQAENTAKIASDTHNLGTDVPSSQGGLIGGGSYFTSRYQTPQTNAAISDIRATIQAKALNDVLENEQNFWKNQYLKAYSAAQSRASSTSSTSSETPTDQGEVEYKSTTPEASSETSVTATGGLLNLVDPSGMLYTRDLTTGEWKWTDSRNRITESSKTEPGGTGK